MITARKSVFDLLNRVISGGAYSNIALDTALKKSGLGVRDKAFATALFYGVLERRITLDEIINKLRSVKTEKEIEYIEGIEPCYADALKFVIEAEKAISLINNPVLEQVLFHWKIKYLWGMIGLCYRQLTPLCRLNKKKDARN